MKNIKSDIVIIGGGLTGLSLAYFLRNTKLSINIIEAREQLGGRIFTLRNGTSPPVEMGATWLGKKHTALIALLEELNVGIFEQVFGRRAIYEPISTSPPQLVQLPPNNDPSFRIKNGTSSVINKLSEKIDTYNIYLEQKVNAIKEKEYGVIIQTNKNVFAAAIVVSTLPPNLFLNTIEMNPALPSDLAATMSKTHTWMGESIKVALTFEQPFWRADNLSGTIFSSVGPIPEMYDHSNVEDNKFALVGFLNGSYFSVSKDDRLKMILEQLQKYYGNKINNYLTYEEAVWRNEPLTFHSYNDHVLPHQFNGHPIFRKTYLNNKLIFAGAETATLHPGYMDGAVRSAAFVAHSLQQLFS